GIRDRNVTGVQTCALPISEKLAVSIRATAKESSGCNRESANRMICSALLTCRLYEPEVSTSRYTPVLCGTVDEQALSSSAAPTKSRQFMAAPPAAIRPRWPVAAHAQPPTAPRSTVARTAAGRRSAPPACRDGASRYRERAG